MQEDVKIIINQISDILKNPKNESPDKLGSYIVGATIVREDIEEYYKKYPLLEEIAELGADLETLADSTHSEKVLADIHTKLKDLQNIVKS